MLNQRIIKPLLLTTTLLKKNWQKKSKIQIKILKLLEEEKIVEVEVKMVFLLTVKQVALEDHLQENKKFRLTIKQLSHKTKVNFKVEIISDTSIVHGDYDNSRTQNT